VASFVVRREAGDVTIGPALAFGQRLGGVATRGDSAGRLRVVSGSRAARCGVPGGDEDSGRQRRLGEPHDPGPARLRL
jgi:hypothetical protein